LKPVVMARLQSLHLVDRARAEAQGALS